MFGHFTTLCMKGLSCSITHETTRAAALLYYMLSFILLVSNVKFENVMTRIEDVKQC